MADSLLQQKQQLEQAQRQLQLLKSPSKPLPRMTPLQRQQYLQGIKKFEGDIETGRQQLQQFEEVQGQYESQVAEQQQEISDWDTAKDMYSRIPFEYTIDEIRQIHRFSRSVAEKIKQYQNEFNEAQRKRQEYIKQIEDLKNQGFQPVYVDGKLTGFEDVNKGMSVPLPNFEGYVEKYYPQPVEITPPTTSPFNINYNLGMDFQKSYLPTTPVEVPEQQPNIAQKYGREGVKWLGRNVWGALDLVTTYPIPIKPAIQAWRETKETFPILESTNIPTYGLIGVGPIGFSLTGEDISKAVVEIKKPRLDEELQVKSNVDKKFEQPVFNTFYKIYGTDIDSGKLTYEQAFAQFEKTREYENLSKRYQDEYNKQLSNLGFNGITKGRLLSIGGDVINLLPKSPAEQIETATLFGGAGYMLGPKLATVFVARKPISEFLTTGYEASYQPKTQVGGFVKGGIFSAVVPEILTSAYGAEIAVGLATDTTQTLGGLYEFGRERPGEFLGFLAGGGLIKGGVKEILFRTITEKPLNVKTYTTKFGTEIKYIEIPKYGKVAWVEGKISQSEKVPYLKQVEMLMGEKPRISTHVSGNGTPLTTFLGRKGVGFQVKAIDKPMRGFYETPPWLILETLFPQTYGSGAASYYAGGFRRESLIPEPIDFLRLMGEGGGKIPEIILRRQMKAVKVADWILDVHKSILGERSISGKAKVMVDTWFDKFMKTKYEWNGVKYKGQAKLDLLNNRLLRGQGNGFKLKYYAALMEYFYVKKVQGVGGAEVASSVSPWGPEHQVVQSIGTRYFVRDFNDLRTSYIPSRISKVVEWFTEYPASYQAVARFGFGKYVGIRPTRAFPKKEGIKERVLKKEEKSPIDNITADLIGEVREERIIERTRRPTELRRIERRIEPVDYLVRRESDREEPRRIREVRRPEIPRREITPERRPERRKPERPREPPPRPPRRPREPPEITTKTKERWLLLPDKKYVRRLKKEKIKKPRDYRLRPTAFQLTEEIALTSEKPLSQITGFELFR